jgi:hypothetical protein
MQHKNDYSCVVFFADGSPKKWTYVHKLSGFIKFLNEKHKGWKYCNVYDRRTAKYIRRFYPGNLVPNFLSVLLVLLILSASQAQDPRPLNSTFNNSYLKRSLSGLLTFKDTFGTFNNGFNNTATISTHLQKKGVGI